MPSGHDANGPGLGLSLHSFLIYPHPKAGLGVFIHCGHSHCRAMVAEVWCWWLHGGARWGNLWARSCGNGGSELQYGDGVRAGGKQGGAVRFG